ncbi:MULTISPECIES: sulfatase family protein [unclassified Saccharicrinis]|uniref:sulfatase family protein n=1 Tax=unclassified Saccharicrinis TaxID=2646859 RepID=UPI003D3412DA
MNILSRGSGIIKGLLFCISLMMMGCTQTPQPPNVIIFFTDDQGYQDVGCFGSPLIKTPNLDQMAEDGMRFTDFYSASSVCSPSRAALLTGCYPPRVGVPRVLWPYSETGLDTKEVTIADLLKQRGYETACIGKWHLGDKPEHLPVSQGFDRYFGIPFSNDMSVNRNFKVASDIVLREGMTLDSLREEKWRGGKVPLMENDEVIEYPVDQTYLTKRYTEEAIKFIQDKRDKPFFLYLAHTMPHIPLYPSPDFKGRSERGLYGDVIEELDWSMGQILKSLEDLGLDKNTLVVFTSDNGPWNLKNGHGGSALPLRGFKFQTYEGGMREPMIAQWKGKIPAGTVCSEIASTIDLMPTIANLTGSSLTEKSLDGKDIWPLLSGQKGAKTPHEAFYFYKDTVLEAIRNAEWKLRVVNENVELYNLKNDISETTNRADENPEVVQRLQKMMEDYDNDLKNNLH